MTVLRFNHDKKKMILSFFFTMAFDYKCQLLFSNQQWLWSQQMFPNRRHTQIKGRCAFVNFWRWGGVTWFEPQCSLQAKLNWSFFLLNNISFSLCRLNEGHDYIMSLLAVIFILRLAVWSKSSLVPLLFWIWRLV